jgi:hypothetical protein
VFLTAGVLMLIALYGAHEDGVREVIGGRRVARSSSSVPRS